MNAMKLIYAICICLILFSCKSDQEEYVVANEDSLNTLYYKNLIENSKLANIPRPADTYIYPVVPGTDRWKELSEKGQDEIVKVCRVPKSVLQKQSTAAVIQTFVDHPFSLDMYLSSSTLLDGFKKSVEYIDPYSELQERKDAGLCLLERYQLFAPAAPSLLFNVYEMLLAQPEFYTQLNGGEKRALIKAVLEKAAIRIELDPELNQVGLGQITYFLLGRIMQNAEYAPFCKKVKSDESLRRFLKSMEYGFENYDDIFYFATQFLK
ncbi:MAG: hypothetical protein PARBB_02465 [Parabacteroides distasonis]|uniref:hypothetical protein n=1 Tax=Parabacteroides sp. TaxID=1869337 RepID=UPI00257FD92F|nr:hypothetical protein [Parabacteroides sp.]